MDIGYARCSTDKQELEAQLRRLEAAGVDPARIYTDVALSGTKRDRAGLNVALAAARGGDTIHVTKLDRLSRSLRDLLDLTESMQARGVNLRVLDQGIDTSSPAGRFFFHVIGAIAEFERELIRERTREGMAVARSRGKLKGRAPKLSRQQQEHLRKLAGAGEHTISELATLFGVSRPTVYRTLERAA